MTTRYVLTATDVEGHIFGHRTSAEPTVAEAAELGELHEADYVLAGHDDVVSLYGRDADGSWSMITADVDAETAAEMCLWFDLTHHYHGRSSIGTGPGGPADHPLARISPRDEAGRIDAARAISLVVERIRARGLDYPTQGLAADRFEGGWSVYAPVEVDESDPMAFLDMPVGRSVFLVGDLGRIKELTSSVPPQQAHGLFTAEEAFVRRGTVEERYMAEFRDEVMRLDGRHGGSAVSDFTVVNDPPEEMIAAKASHLLTAIVQQLAQLGPQGWRRFGVVFSYTVSGEIGRMRFWTDRAMDLQPVPEQIAVLVRRHRHLAARMPAGPWWRLLLTVTGGGEMTVDYDYGDVPLPAEDLQDPEHYRNDLDAYPRTRPPVWLLDYIAGDATGHTGAATATARVDVGTAPAPAAPATVSERVRKIGDDEGLGDLWGIYPAEPMPASRLGGFALAAAVLAILGIVVLATADALGAVLLAAAAPFAVYVLRGLAANTRTAGTCAGTFESGLVYIDDLGQASVLRWHTSAVHQRIVHHTRNGAHTRTTYEYRLTGPDGPTLTLRRNSAMPGLADPEKWGREIQQGITSAQLPFALRVIADGGTVTFGPIQVTGEAVAANGGGPVPWSAVEKIDVSQGRVALRVAGKWLALIHTEVGRIPNFFVFHALAQHLRTEARGA